MTPIKMLTAEPLDTIRVNRERLTSQDDFLEKLKASCEGLLSQEQLLTQVSTLGKVRPVRSNCFKSFRPNSQTCSGGQIKVRQ